MPETSNSLEMDEMVLPSAHRLNPTFFSAPAWRYDSAASGPVVTAPTATDLRPWARSRRSSPLIAAALASFAVGITFTHVQEHYARLGECHKWRANVRRWSEVVADGTSELGSTETTALVLAQGALIAVRDRMCGY